MPVDLKAKFEEDKNGNKTMMVTINNGSPALFQSFEPIKEENQDITTYIGSFYSPELETTYQVLIKDQKLMGHHSRHGDFPIQMLKKNILQIPGFAIIKYELGVDDKVGELEFQTEEQEMFGLKRSNSCDCSNYSS